jgi:hypothetical protein
MAICLFAKAQQSIDPRIQEVYGEKTQEVFQNDPERLSLLTDLLDNRIKLIESPVVGEDKYTKLSAVPLLNKYNPNLTRDVVFDINTFNPLKYNLNFFTTEIQIYRIDNTDYLLVIDSQKQK